MEDGGGCPGGGRFNIDGGAGPLGRLADEGYVDGGCPGGAIDGGAILTGCCCCN